MTATEALEIPSPPRDAAGHMTVPEHWCASSGLSDIEVDCVIALMLKILDGKCKMNATDKALMARLYDAMGARDGRHLGGVEHALIAQAREVPSPESLERVYECRVLAETCISRPVMKGFKARLRRDGVLPSSLTMNDSSPVDLPEVSTDAGNRIGNDADLDQLRRAIAETVARRDALKAEMQAWYDANKRGGFTGLAELEAIDQRLSSLDTRFKRAFDKTTVQGG